MRNLPGHIASLSVTLWVGGMWLLGYVVVPVLFKMLPDRMLAGRVAGELFTWMAYIGIVCALYLMLYLLQRQGGTAWRSTAFRVIAAMLLLVLLGQFVMQPALADLKAQVAPLDVMQSVHAQQFRNWHAVSSIAYLIQSLLGAWLAVIWRAPRIDSTAAQG